MTDNNSSKPKILYVITQGEWGGAQRYVFDLATKLNNDFKVFVAIGEKSGKNDLQKKILKKYSTNIIKILQLKHLVRKISPIHDILAVFELAKLYKTLKPDIIHLNSSKAGIIGSFAKLFLNIDSCFRRNDRIKIVYTVHGWVFNEPTRKLGRILYRFLEKITAKIKDKIIVLSDRDYQDGLDSCFRRNDKAGREKLVKISLGIKAPAFLDKQTARQELSKLSLITYHLSSTLIGTIANLYPSKGLDILIEAINLLNTKYSIPNTKYIIIGEGPERKKLEKLIKKYQLENTIYLTGTIDNATQYLKAFDLFVLPSRKEGLPYTILEAIAAELPIVAADVGGVAELVENTVPPDNPEKLAEAISIAINNPLLTKNSILTIEKMLEEIKKIYKTQ